MSRSSGFTNTANRKRTYPPNRRKKNNYWQELWYNSLRSHAMPSVLMTLHDMSTLQYRKFCRSIFFVFKNCIDGRYRNRIVYRKLLHSFVVLLQCVYERINPVMCGLLMYIAVSGIIIFLNYYMFLVII